MIVLHSDACGFQALPVSNPCMSKLIQNKQQWLLPQSLVTPCYCHTQLNASQLDDTERLYFQVACAVECRGAQLYNWVAHSNVTTSKLVNTLLHTGVLGHGSGAL